MDQIQTQAVGDGQQDGQHQGEDSAGLHDHAQNQQQNIDDQQDDGGIAADAQDHVGHLAGDALHGHDVSKQGGGADDEQGVGGGDGGVLQALAEGLPVQGPVQKQGDEQGVDHRDGGGLRGGEPAAHEAAQDDDRGDEGGDGAQELANQRLEAEGVALILAHDGEAQDHDHQQQAHEHAGDHAAHK